PHGQRFPGPIHFPQWNQDPRPFSQPDFQAYSISRVELQMELAKLVGGCPGESAYSGNQEDGKSVARTLPFAIQHLTSDRCPAKSFRELDREINDRALILIGKLSHARGQSPHPCGYRGPKAIKNEPGNPHAADRLLPRSPADHELLKCGPELRKHAFLGELHQ